MFEASGSRGMSSEANNDPEVGSDDEKIVYPIGVDDTSSRLSVFLFEKLLEDYPSLSKYNPVLPTKDQRADRPPHGKIALYRTYFTSANLRLPVTDFYLRVLAYYQIGFSQMQPVGAGKILTFQMILAALGLPCSLYLFRKFFRLCTTGDWFTVEARKEYGSLITNAPGTLKFWRFDYFFVDATFIPSGKECLLRWRDTSNKKECSRFVKRINELPDESMIKKKHFERVKRISIPYRSYQKFEAFLILAKISKGWEGETTPMLVEKSTRKPMSLLEGLGMDPDELDVAVRDSPPVGGGLSIEGGSVVPPDDSLYFSPDRDNIVGFDNSHLISHNDENDRVSDYTRYVNDRGSLPSAAGDHSCGLSRGKRIGGDMESPFSKRPTLTHLPPGGLRGLASSSSGPGIPSFTGADLEKAISSAGPMKRSGFHCTEPPTLQPITGTEGLWDDLRRLAAYRLGYDNSTGLFSFPSLRGDSSPIPHPTTEFQQGLGNDYFVPAPVLRLKDDVRHPDAARRYADSVVPPVWAAETSLLALSRLTQVYDVAAAHAFISGAVLRECCVSELDILTKKVGSLSADKEAMRTEVDKCKSEKQLCEGEVQLLKASLTARDAEINNLEAELELERSRVRELESEVEVKAQSRRHLLLAFPDLFKRVLGHQDVMSVISSFNRAARAFGQNYACERMSEIETHIEVDALPFYDSSAIKRLKDADSAFKEKAFPILDAIVRDSDASLEDIMSIIDAPPSSSSGT